MQVQRIQNNNYNTNFGSKFKFVGVDPSTGRNGIEMALDAGSRRGDRTFLKAMKGLLNDGLPDEYVYTISQEYRKRCGISNWLDISNPCKKSEKYSLLDKTRVSVELFRDLMVNFAREKGLISGKPVHPNKIINIYDPYVYSNGLNYGVIDEKLQCIGFKKYSSNTKQEKDAIRDLIKDELDEIQRIRSSKSANKHEAIVRVRENIDEKINQQIADEYETLKQAIFCS